MDPPSIKDRMTASQLVNTSAVCELPRFPVRSEKNTSLVVPLLFSQCMRTVKPGGSARIGLLSAENSRNAKTGNAGIIMRVSLRVMRRATQSNTKLGIIILFAFLHP